MPISTHPSPERRTTDLVGRLAEMDAACAALEAKSARLLTVTGVAGVGKTRFATALGERLAPGYPDGLVAIDLTAIDDPDALDVELGRAIGMGERDRSDVPGAVDAWLAEHTALLLLDNAEHVLAVADRVVQWLTISPNSRVIVTSRHRLNVSVETELYIDTLPVAANAEGASAESLSPAARLFLDIAGAGDPATLAPDALTAVERVCARLEGLPLAVELVAARTSALDEAAMNRIVDEETLALQSNGEVGAVLEQAFEGSYRLLSPSSRQLLRYLTVFEGGFTLELAEYLADHARLLALQNGTADRLDELGAHHLILPADQPRTRTAGPTFRMPLIVADIARSRLVAAELEDARQAHARAMLQFAERREFSGLRPGLEHEVAELGLNMHNVVAALVWFRDQHDGEGLQRLVAALWWFWYAHGFYSDGLAWLEEAQRHDGPRDNSRWGLILTVFGVLLNLRGETDRARTALDDAWKVQSRFGSDMEQAITATAQGIVTFQQGHHDQSDAWFARAIDLTARISDHEIARTIAGYAWENLGANAHERGQLDDSDHAYRQALQTLAQSGSVWSIARTYCDLGNLLRDRNDLQGALDAFHTALEPDHEIGDPRLLAAILAGVASVLTEDNQPLLAAWLWGAVDALRPAAGEPSLLRVNVSAYQRSRMVARRRLGTGGFAAAVRHGVAAPRREAIARARQARLRRAHAMEIPAEINRTLTNRERYVLDLLVQDASTVQIAEMLGISDRTVSSHIGSLLRKFGVTSRLALLAASTRPD